MRSKLFSKYCQDVICHFHSFFHERREWTFLVYVLCDTTSDGLQKQV